MGGDFLEVKEYILNIVIEGVIFDLVFICYILRCLNLCSELFSCFEKGIVIEFVDEVVDCVCYLL